MEPLRGPIEEMAAHFANIAKSTDKIVVKYDTDGDGLSGALILYRMFEKLGKKDVIYVQSPSPVYRVEDGARDVQDYKEAHFIFIDGGNNNDSEEGLKIIRKDAKSVSIIDHHLSTREKAPGEMVVTPIWHGLGCEYTSGFLCFEIARRVCDADYDVLWKASLYCDKSTLEFELTSEVKEMGLVLDYISTIMDHEKHSMKFIDELISNEHMRHTEYLAAKDALETATSLALSITRINTLENGVLLVLVEVGRIVESGQFPPRGKITGRVHDTVLERKEYEGKAIVTIGYTSDSIMLRANIKAQEIGFNGNEIINGFKKEMGNVVISGGGHVGAAAMKFDKGYKNVVLDAFTRKIASLHG